MSWLKNDDSLFHHIIKGHNLIAIWKVTLNICVKFTKKNQTAFKGFLKSCSLSIFDTLFTFKMF